jgi:hypothetical protein
MKKPIGIKYGVHPQINYTLIHDALIRDLADGGNIVFIDDCKWNANDWIINHNPIPFMERNGRDWVLDSKDVGHIAEKLDELGKQEDVTLFVERHRQKNKDVAQQIIHMIRDNRVDIS